MKIKHIFLMMLACTVVLAVVGCKRAGSEGDTQHTQKITADLKELNKEIESLKADLESVKFREKDYIKEMREVVEKQARKEIRPAELKQSGAGLRIAVVSIRKIFQECERGVRYREEAVVEQNRIVSELGQLSREIEAERADLATLKADSSDYMTRAKKLFEKQANYQARQEFYKQQMELKDQLWTKELYQDIVRVAGEVAEEKGLDLVFREDEVDFSETNVGELGLAMRVQNLLYSGGCMDITAEVAARLNAGKDSSAYSGW